MGIDEVQGVRVVSVALKSEPYCLYSRKMLMVNQYHLHVELSDIILFIS